MANAVATEMSVKWSADGRQIGEGPIRVRSAHFASGLFTADAAEVARWLPTSRLRPQRAWRGRTPVLVYIAEQEWTVGSAPATRFGAFGVMARLTRGEQQPSPLALVPLTKKRVRRYGFGSLLMVWAATNRPTVDVLDGALGIAGFVADVAIEQNGGTVSGSCQQSGETIASLQIRPSARTRQQSHWSYLYGVRDGQVIAIPSQLNGDFQVRYGPGSGKLMLGRHPIADQLRRMGISGTASYCDYWRNCTECYQPQEVVGPQQRHRTPCVPNPVESGLLTIGHPAVVVDASEQLESAGLRPETRLRIAP